MVSTPSSAAASGDGDAPALGHGTAPVPGDGDAAAAGPSPARRSRWRRRPGELPAPPPWARRRVPWATSVAVFVLQQAGTGFAAHNQRAGDVVGPDGAARLLLTLGPLLLLVRYRYPRCAVCGTAAVTLAYLAAGYPYGPILISVVVAGFAALVTGHRYVTWSALGVLWVGNLLVAHTFHHLLPPGGDAPRSWGTDLFMLVWMVALCTAGELARVRRAERERRQREAEEAEQRRAGEERLRIARELHDVLAHSISVINVQAGVGLALLDAEPEQARTALTTIKAASKEALGEVRQVLDTLRAPGEAPRAPAPGLDRLAELTEQAARAGLQVATETEGAPVPLPPGADLAAFRIVQEALTNIVRHSGSRTARVRLHYGGTAMDLLVDDEGPATGSGPTGGGMGLVGMRERAAAFGGTLEAGPRPGGGFRVLATIPLPPPQGGAPLQ
ncbi:sensor histidine kinase [Streptomyces tubbatahanensis]|uniref:histidine kinase n=1 Tax=Streptomyces tubbatahanensis TaxID=2923272 RepID=A0ABY3XMH0_9ACTN|nr:sensor histidine kinase [Streptomyces tubbatahanensis]UNS95604.1 sensor histidine kinase [Streptomyces tubbatahanensis]